MIVKRAFKGMRDQGFLFSPWRPVCALQPLTYSRDDAQQSNPRDGAGVSMSTDYVVTAIPIKRV